MPNPLHHVLFLPARQAASTMLRQRIARLAWHAIVLATMPVMSHAGQDRLIMGGEGLAAELPSLPGEARAEQADALHVAPESIALRDGAADGMVGMRLDNYRDDLPSLSLEKGWLVSNNLAMGGAYTVRSKASELVLNAVYATRPDARILLSVSQLRAADAAYAQNGDARTVLQTSYLSSFRKQWGKSRMLPEAGMAIFVSRAAGADRRSTSSDGLEMGTLAGAMLRVAARPMLRTRVELSYQAQSTVYDNPLTAYDRDRQASGSLDYSHTFNDCSRLHGRYTGGHGLSKTDLAYEKGAFRLGFLQVRGAEYSDNRVQLRYSLPLGRARHVETVCDGSPAAPSGFRTMVDAATTRSPYLPSTPVTRTLPATEVPG
ncbi:MAG TPA: hypothetical protein VF797_18255 [Noviherbaspirillum sp.]